VSIFVGNLPFRAEQEDVIELFAQFGEVTNCALPLERDTGRKRGFAFIEMADESTEEAAIEGLQGAELMGRPLRINKAEPRGSAPRRGGGYRGGGGGAFRTGVGRFWLICVMLLSSSAYVVGAFAYSRTNLVIS